MRGMLRKIYEELKGIKNKLQKINKYLELSESMEWHEPMEWKEQMERQTYIWKPDIGRNANNGRKRRPRRTSAKTV